MNRSSKDMCFSTTVQKAESCKERSFSYSPSTSDKKIRTRPTQLTLRLRFPTKAVEISPIPFDVELSELRQRSDEALVSFNKRVTSLMQRVGAKDRPALTSSTTLTLLESAMLDTILRAFIKGISDHTVQREATRGMAATDRSLKSIYNLAEEARRTNLEIQKLFEEEIKSKELIFYKDLAERNMSKSQIDALMTAYHSAATPNQGPGWTFHSDPPQFQPAPPLMPATYKPETADRALILNPNRGNMGSKPPARKFEPYVLPKDLPDRKTSKNQWINGTRTWSFQEGRLCVKCGHVGHVSKECKNNVLPAWEQSYLKSIVFGESPQSNFAMASYGLPEDIKSARSFIYCDWPRLL